MKAEHHADDTEAIHGIAVYRASRLEALLDPLLTLLDSSPPANVLAPHSIVAAHPGMRQWLTGALARKRGTRAIVANLDVQLPSAWLDRLAQDVLGEPAVALRPYRHDALRWPIHECLDTIEDAQVVAYLQGDDVARRRFQLADRLARIYTRYLVYRPDWLRAWTDGRDNVPQPTFLAPLWRRVREHIGVPHRGEMLGRLTSSLAASRPAGFVEEPLHVFGISHLAPSELATLRAVARHRLVVLYVPDPCIEYWAGLRTERTVLRDLVALDVLPANVEEHFLELGHPLLASWGRIGQHFMLALTDSDARIDLRHGRDEIAPPAPLTRLQGVQESVRRLNPLLIEPGQPSDTTALADRSLRIHSCHTRLRELEVLRDVLLRERLERPDLKPSEIIVMAPNIQAYVPLLGAVFGEPARQDATLPWHLADVAVSRSHRLFAAFETLLDLPQSRLTAPEVMDLVEMPEIARALGLDAAGIEALDGWLQRSRVAWALDPEFREDFGVPGIVEHTFAWGMDRLLAGYVLGEAQGDGVVAQDLPDGASVMPVEGVHGPQAEVIGALDRLLQELAGLRRDMRQARRASAWGARLERLIDTLFRADPFDTDAREAQVLLRRFVRAIAAEAAESDLDPVLEFSVLREVLRERLAAAPERQRFLLGGITFCGMVPQRAIPFRVVAVLGLNDGEFPRTASDGGLDLMARYRRLGDRDTRSDDRYLFLETLMAARDVLHLSYLGEGVRDAKPRNPATPLAELLTLLDERAGLAGADPEHDRPWRVRHPLQPFDARYFDAVDARLFSFRADMARLAGDEPRAARAFLDATASAEPESSAVAPVPLSEVFAYYKDPAKQVLRNALHLRLDALGDDSLRTSEPLDARFESIDRVGQRLFFDALDNGGFQLPDAPPDWLRLDGLWPPARLGDAAWEKQSKQVQSLLDEAACEPLFAGAAPPRHPVAIDCSIAGFRALGELTRVWRTRDALCVLDIFPDKKEEDLTFKERIGLFLEWALLRLVNPDGCLPVRLLLLTEGPVRSWQGSLNAWDDAFVDACQRGDEEAVTLLLTDLREHVGGLLAFWSAAQVRPPWYFPKTSWIAATDPREQKALDAWRGGERVTGERDYAPGCAALLARDATFEPEHVDFESLCDTAHELLALINVRAEITT